MRDFLFIACVLALTFILAKEAKADQYERVYKAPFYVVHNEPGCSFYTEVKDSSNLFVSNNKLCYNTLLYKA